MDAGVLKHVFVRHPPLPGVGGRCYGRLDLALEADAFADAARALRPALPDWPLVSSPSQRCAGLARALRGREATLDARLQEMDFGEWEGRPWDTIPRELLDAWGRDVVGFRPPGGESFADLIERVAAALAELRTPHVVITHGGVIRAAWHLQGGLTPAEAAGVPVPHAQPVVPGHGAGSTGMPGSMR